MQRSRGGRFGVNRTETSRPLRERNDVRVVDAVPSSTEPDDVQVIEGDVRNDPNVDQAVSGVDVVFHQAALVDVEQVGRFPPSFRSVPVGRGLLDVERLGNAVRRAGVDWVVYEDDDPADPVEAIRQGVTAVAPFVGPGRSVRSDASSSTTR